MCALSQVERIKKELNKRIVVLETELATERATKADTSAFELEIEEYKAQIAALTAEVCTANLLIDQY